jgi:citrate lyase subunit beta/citryl-CoA lyase
MAKLKKASAGKRGAKVRSDCYFEIELTKKGKIKIELKSKVDSMYGESIKKVIKEMCSFFEISDAKILLEDSGSLLPTLIARFELAVKRLNPEITKEYLPGFNKKNKYKTSKDRLRRTRLYLPGNEPKFYPNAGLHKPDGIILDLEDSVAHSEKDAAQILVRNTLRTINLYGAERMVRINQLPKGLDDLKYIVPHNVHVILIPKCESKDDIIKIEEEVAKLKKENKVKDEIYFMPIILLEFKQLIQYIRMFQTWRDLEKV